MLNLFFAGLLFVRATEIEDDRALMEGRPLFSAFNRFMKEDSAGVVGRLCGVVGLPSDVFEALVIMDSLDGGRLICRPAVLGDVTLSNSSSRDPGDLAWLEFGMGLQILEVRRKRGKFEPLA